MRRIEINNQVSLERGWKEKNIRWTDRSFFIDKTNALHPEEIGLKIYDAY